MQSIKRHLAKQNVIPISLNTLTDIGLKFKTDKVYSDHTFFNKNYMNHYEKYFEEIRYLPIKFLEIGVLDGASLRTWREYFPNSEIHGIDIRPECKAQEDLQNNIHVHIIDCSDEDSLNIFKQQYTSYFDVILDDGSHINDITLLTFQVLYHCVKPIGYYIIEDLGTTYINKDLTKYTVHWPGISHMNNTYEKNDPITILDLYSQIHSYIDNPKATNIIGEATQKTPYNIEYLHHYTYIVVMRKNEMYKH